MNPEEFNKKRGQKNKARIVGQSRNEYGTRHSHRITCTYCKKDDYVAKKLNTAKYHYCRDCAKKFLNTYDAGQLILETKVKRTCSMCKISFEVKESIALKKDELLCNDCHRGFAVWRGSYKNPHKENTQVIIKKGLILRKKSK